MSKALNPEEVVLDIAAPDVKESFVAGVMPDWFDFKVLTGGLVFICTLVLIMIFGVAELYNYYSNKVNDETQLNLKYVDTARLRDADAQRLSTTGVADEKAGTYHIPIDKAIDLVAQPAN